MQADVLTDGGAGGQQCGESFRPLKQGEPVRAGLLQADDSGHGTALVPVAGCLPAPRRAVDRHHAVLYPQHGIVVIQQAAVRKGLQPLPGVRALARAALAEEKVAPAFQAGAGGMDGNGVPPECRLGVEDAEHGRQYLPHGRVLHPEEGRGIVKSGVHSHEMCATIHRTVTYLRPVTAGNAQKAYMPHVVGRLVQQLRAFPVIRKGTGVGKQPENPFPFRAFPAPERTEGGQQRLRVQPTGKDDGERQPRHPEKIFVSHLRFPIISLTEIQNASLRA